MDNIELHLHLQL